jgi:predicted component of type VI protein secretion system
MAQGFRVRYRSPDGKVQGEVVRFQLPIRIGRNELNHCRIVDRYVSDFHAQIELVGGKLCVRDLHSKNGIYSTETERVGMTTPFELTPPDRAFVLGQYVEVFVDVFEAAGPLSDERPPRSVGEVLGNESMLHKGGSQDLPPQLGPLPGLSMAGQPPARAVVEPQADRRYSHSPVMESLPGLAHLPQSRDDARFAPAPQAAMARPASHGTQHFTMQVDTLAFLGLKELAASLVPGATLQTTGDVARLITKLHDAVEVFCRCFVPLREGYSQFVSQMDLRRAASQRTLNRSPSALRVETARDPAALAAALLDWRNEDYDVPQAIEGILADLMIHQIALIDSLMQGVRALLQELSPEKIEQALQAERGGMPAILGRYRALWQAFEKRYEEMSNDTRTFELVFGPEFAAAYQGHVARERPR